MRHRSWRREDFRRICRESQQCGIRLRHRLCRSDTLLYDSDVSSIGTRPRNLLKSKGDFLFAEEKKKSLYYPWRPLRCRG